MLTAVPDVIGPGEGSASDEPEAARGGSEADDEPATPGEGSASDEPEAARGGSEADDEPATACGASVIEPAGPEREGVE